MPMKIIINVGEKQHNFLLLCEDTCQNVADVKQFCYCRFPHLQNGADLRIFWNDQDGDEICVVTDDDYKSFMLAAGEDKHRLYVEAKEAMQVDASVCPVQSAPDDYAVASRPVHQNIICDACDREVVGHLYRCLTCYGYELCMTCESKYRHKDHIMLRIPRPLRSRTLSYQVIERMERYAAKLDLMLADGDVDGKKLVTVEADYSTDKKR
uniref:Uncharacterized protein n=1 Tax=Anopheles atroparvus TaxID=41427 RepID=A0A182JMC0_ANOAO